MVSFRKVGECSSDKPRPDLRESVGHGNGTIVGKCGAVTLLVEETRVAVGPALRRVVMFP